MFQDKYIFAQLTAFLNRTQFNNYVRKYDGYRYVKHFTCWNQLLAMMFGQLSNRESLRDLKQLCEALHNFFRDAKGYTGLMDCQARDKWKLDFAFNASFTSLNVAKVTMKEMGMEYSMSSFKSLMTNIYLVRRIFKACGYIPNRTLISKIFKDLSCLQRIAA